MTTRPRHCSHTTHLECTVSGALVGAMVLCGVALAESPMSVPAEFVSFVSPPGVTDHFERPSAIHVDTAHGEMIIADPGNNRVAIFDTNGNFRFEFFLGEETAMPMDLAVDSRGFIYIVGSTVAGRRIFQFDFDGQFLNEVPMPYLTSGIRPQVHSIDINGDDHLVLLDRDDLRITICTNAGDLVGSFLLEPQMSTQDRNETVLGSLAVSGDRIYVPFSNSGTVFAYSTEGERLGSYGYKGTNPGQLAFPVAVAISDDLVAVLDKHRFNVVCFGSDGRFLGEFGGKGISPGWFYHPTLLGVGPESQVYVGQIFQNKVQICRIPNFIESNRRPSATVQSTQGS